MSRPAAKRGSLTERTSPLAVRGTAAERSSLMSAANAGSTLLSGSSTSSIKLLVAGCAAPLAEPNHIDHCAGSCQDWSKATSCNSNTGVSSQPDNRDHIPTLSERTNIMNQPPEDVPDLSDNAAEVEGKAMHTKFYQCPKCDHTQYVTYDTFLYRGFGQCRSCGATIDL